MFIICLLVSLLASLSGLVDLVSVGTIAPETITLIVAGSSVQTSAGVITPVIQWLASSTWKYSLNYQAHITSGENIIYISLI